MLKFKATHMFIASHRWDSISIELSDNLNEEDVKYLPKASENVYCRLPSTINEKMLSLLCSVYPDKAGQLRLNYMLQKDITIFLPKEAE